MRADELMSWDAIDLARMLATGFMDPDDLVAIFPSIDTVDSFDSDIFPEFIDKNWSYLLGYYNVNELESWLERNRYKEEWDEWRAAMAEYDYEYTEWKMEEYCWKVIEIVDMLRYQDLAEQWGHPPKKIPC